jgi:hypothetical protein
MKERRVWPWRRTGYPAPRGRRRERIALNVAWLMFVAFNAGLVSVASDFLTAPERLRWLDLAVPFGLAVIVACVIRLAWTGRYPGQ